MMDARYRTGYLASHRPETVFRKVVAEVHRGESMVGNLELVRIIGGDFWALTNKSFLPTL